MSGNQKNKLLWVTFVLLLLISCDRNKIFEKYVSIPEHNWNTNAPLSFDFEVNDTNQYCNMYINIRYADTRNIDGYPYRNMYMFMKTTRPDGTRSVDTLEFYFIDVAGKPLGKCSGDVCDSRFMIDYEFRFPMPGKYVFELQQAMRTEDGNLPMVMDVGMRVEKTTKTQKP